MRASMPFLVALCLWSTMASAAGGAGAAAASTPEKLPITLSILRPRHNEWTPRAFMLDVTIGFATDIYHPNMTDHVLCLHATIRLVARAPDARPGTWRHCQPLPPRPTALSLTDLHPGTIELAVDMRRGGADGPVVGRAALRTFHVVAPEGGARAAVLPGVLAALPYLPPELVNLVLTFALEPPRAAVRSFSPHRARVFAIACSPCASFACR